MLVNYSEAGIYHVKPLMFKPGINNVSVADWSAVKEHPDVKAHLESGVLKVISNKESEPSKSLKEFKPKEAVRLVKQTLDHELLVAWYDGEGRKEVSDAIEQQLKKLELDTAGKPLAVEAAK